MGSWDMESRRKKMRDLGFELDGISCSCVRAGIVRKESQPRACVGLRVINIIVQPEEVLAHMAGVDCGQVPGVNTIFVLIPRTGSW